MRRRFARRSSLRLMQSPGRIDRRDDEDFLEDDDNDDSEFPRFGKGRGKGKGNWSTSLPSSQALKTFIPSSSSSLPQPSDTTNLSTSSGLPQPTLLSSSAPISITVSSTEGISVTGPTPSTLETSVATTQPSIITAEPDIILSRTSIFTTQISISTTQTDSSPSLSTSRESSYATTSNAPTQAVNGNGGLSRGEIAGIVVGPLAFLFLSIAAIFLILRRRRKNPSQTSGLKFLFKRMDTKPPLGSLNHARETRESPMDQEARLFNTTLTTIEKPRPAATLLASWLSQLRQSHHSTNSAHHHYPPEKLPQDTPASSDSDNSSSASILSLPATFRTRHTNSTFLPTTALHHPRRANPNPNLDPDPDPDLVAKPHQQQQLQTPSNETIGIASQKKEGQPISALNPHQPGSAIPLDVRLSSLGGGGGGGVRQGNVIHPP